MKALILASGEGKRLRPLTYTLPKPLLTILEDKTILDYQMDNLISCNITDILITTGPFEDTLKAYVEKNYPNLNVSYVNNPRYETTNYIYSLWLTKERIDDDVILLHGDLVFDKILLERLIAENGNRVLVNKKPFFQKESFSKEILNFIDYKNIEALGKDFKAVVVNDRVIKIGVEFSGENAFACLPLYKISKADFLFWINECEEYIKKGEVNIYAENVFNVISDDLLLFPLYFDDELCMEIDTEDELEIAERCLDV
jgi:choline kinase